MFGKKPKVKVVVIEGKDDKELAKRLERQGNDLAKDGYRQASITRADSLLRRRVSVTYERQDR